MDGNFEPVVFSIVSEFVMKSVSKLFVVKLGIKLVVLANPISDDGSRNVPFSEV